MKRILINLIFISCIQNCYAQEKSMCKGKMLVTNTDRLILSTCMAEDENGIYAQNGPHFVSDSDGNIVIRGQLRNGSPVGEWLNFDKEGVIIKRCIYEYKDEKMQSKCFDNNGNLIEPRL